jgi:hypothetical protein
VRRYVLAAVIAVLVGAVTPVASTADAVPAHHAQSRSIAPEIVRLPTGDAVRIERVAGRQQLDTVPAERGGVSGVFQTISVGRDSYVFPAEARPFLGRLLDPSLFDVTQLARVEQEGRIPVTLKRRNGVPLHVPGLTVTARWNGGARGYLTKRGADAFRTALVKEWRAVNRSGRAVRPALFDGADHLRVTGAVTPPTPQFQQYTLRIKVLDAAGRPAPDGVVGLMNTDDGRKYGGFFVYRHGGARVSVPAGHYSAITDVLSGGRRDLVDRIVPIADFTVAHNEQTITMDARTAKSRIAVHTPRPAKVTSASMEFDRESNRFGALGDGFEFDGGVTSFIAPTGPARFGRLQWLTTWQLTGTAKKARPYSYDLSFLDNGHVSRHQSHNVAAFELATVRARYYTDRRRGASSMFARTPFYPFQFIVFSMFAPLRTPLARTEDIYAPASPVWQDQFVAAMTRRNLFGGFIADGYRTYSPGEERNTDWLRGPLVPGAPVQTNGDPGFVCVACRAAEKMLVVLAPMTDSTPGHVGDVTSFLHKPRVHFALYRGRTLLTRHVGDTVQVPARPARYDLHVTTKRDLDAAHASTATITDLVFRSSARRGARLPDRWLCPIVFRHSGCRVLELLHAHVPLPTTLTDRMPTGKSSFVLTIAPIQGARPIRITHARFETRLPGGKFRRAALHRLGNGKYRVTLVNPSAAVGRSVTIRVSGRDAQGDSITQTTRAAYFIKRR